MSKDALAIPAAFRGYLLPQSAHDSLITTREQLHLLAQLAEPRGEASGYLVLPRDALAELFTRVAQHLDDALSAVVRLGPELDDE